MTAGLWDSLRDKQLQWLPELGIGWYPVAGQPYDRAYWERYRQYDDTPCGDALTAMRIALVSRYWAGDVTDVGIGGGRFVSERPHTMGYDVNPHAVQWLYSCRRWMNPYANPVDVACFWDSLEHVLNPAPLLANIRKWVFVSLPIFTGLAHLLTSKHLRKDEHCWYFTVAGLGLFMRAHGFVVVEHNRMEQDAGREDIDTFVFRREGAAA